MVLDYIGHSIPLARLTRVLRTTDIGTPASNVRYLAALRIHATYQQGELADIEQALGNGHPADAEQWLVQAVRVDSVSWTGRRALIALGDARVGQGDILAAAIAYQSAADAGADSLGRIARERLSRLGAGGGEPNGRRSQ